jgi:hypothetical protein
MAVQPVVAESAPHRLAITEGGGAPAGAKAANAGPIAARVHGRERGRGQEASAEDSLVIWIGSSQDWHEHAVTLSQVSAAVEAGRGLYSALCGERFVPLPMLSGPRPRCHHCLSLSNGRSRSLLKARRGFWARWSADRRSIRDQDQAAAPTQQLGL